MITGVIRHRRPLRARPAPVCHDALPAMQVIEQLKATPAQRLLVYDEYGHF